MDYEDIDLRDENFSMKRLNGQMVLHFRQQPITRIDDGNYLWVTTIPTNVDPGFLINSFSGESGVYVHGDEIRCYHKKVYSVVYTIDRYIRLCNIR